MIFDCKMIANGLTAPRREEFGQPLGCAAVLVALVKHRNLISLLLTRRALHMRHHGGEVALPGGMWEQGDAFPVATALREAEEEVALAPEQVDVLGVLPTVYTGNKTAVTPVVGMINTNVLPLKANPAEIASIFIVPLVELQSERRIRTDIFPNRGEHVWAPAYDYRGYEIWGVTAGIIRELLVRCFGCDFPKEHHTPKKLW